MGRAVRFIKWWLAAGLLSVIPWVGQAETAYVVDRLLLGIHEDKTLNSPVIAVLPSGAALEILSRKGDFVKVRTTGGDTGWVDGNYLMEEKPAQVLLLELEAECTRTGNALKAAEDRLQVLMDESASAVASAEKTSREIKSNTLRELKELTENNRALTQSNQKLAREAADWRARLQAFEKAASADPNAPPIPCPSLLDPPTFASSPPTSMIWRWTSPSIVGLLAFFLGSYFTKKFIRRRYYLVSRNAGRSRSGEDKPSAPASSA